MQAPKVRRLGSQLEDVQRAMRSSSPFGAIARAHRSRLIHLNGVYFRLLF
ncbi:MAG: hypothetical protein HC879_16780 [Leptolyngbyaceae cyanobacterium SL_5_9]|nr:hypothetical protein [Leptolyngbyaceae cyanobacterium SL_5_9]